MRSFLLRHRHAPHECAAAYAAWKGFDSPLRHHPTISSCVEGGEPDMRFSTWGGGATTDTAARPARHVAGNIVAAPEFVNSAAS